VLVNPFVGSAVDRHGGKRLLIGGLLAQSIVLGFYVAGVLTGHPGALFLVGRLLHGPSSSCVFVAAQTLALHAGGREHKGLASGIVRSAMASGMPAGLVLGGLLAGWFGAARAFEVAMAAPLVAAGIAALQVPDLRASAAAPAHSFRQVLASLGSRTVAAVAAINFVSTFCALGVILTTLVLIIHERSITLGRFSDQTSSGLFMGVLVVFMVLVAPLAGRLSDRRGWRGHVVMAGIVAMVPGVLLIGVARSPAVLAGGLALVGLGMGALTSPLLALLGDLVPVRDARQRSRLLAALRGRGRYARTDCRHVAVGDDGYSRLCGDGRASRAHAAARLLARVGRTPQRKAKSSERLG
jgi:MFS family permease